MEGKEEKQRVGKAGGVNFTFTHAQLEAGRRFAKACLDGIVLEADELFPVVLFKCCRTFNTCPGFYYCE